MSIKLHGSTANPRRSSCSYRTLSLETFALFVSRKIILDLPRLMMNDSTEIRSSGQISMLLPSVKGKSSCAETRRLREGSFRNDRYPGFKLPIPHRHTEEASHVSRSTRSFLVDRRYSCSAPTRTARAPVNVKKKSATYGTSQSIDRADASRGPTRHGCENVRDVTGGKVKRGIKALEKVFFSTRRMSR